MRRMTRICVAVLLVACSRLDIQPNDADVTGDVAHDGACGSCTPEEERICIEPAPQDAVTLTPGANIQQAIDGAAPGATIVLAAGVHELPATLQIAKSVTLRGEGAELTTLRAGPSGAAINVRAGTRDVTIALMKITRGGLWIGNDSARSYNIKIIGNELTDITNPVWSSSAHTIVLLNIDGLSIEQNYFHDLTADYTMIRGYTLWRAKIEYNRFVRYKRIHILGFQDDNSISYNDYAEAEGVPGIAEIQNGTNTRRLRVVGNVVRSYRGLYQEDYCISLAIPGGTDTVMTDNYCNGVPAAEAYWVRPDEKRLGYLEFNMSSGTLQRNVIVSPRTLSAQGSNGCSYAAFVVCGNNTTTFDFHDNQLYGSTCWAVSPFATDGNSSTCHYDSAGTTIDPDVTHAPPLPARPVKSCM